ncbi:TPA: phage head closure protein [Vibrio parahaemolyticus]|uniref:phage head closure protein n=1 Tax=Vibrio alginolyticus TaxID=663 RepID=UPI001303365C|nr:phage head closure protein [Vibrio alginolyticus]MCG6354788.1 phage head closure protein [Vibrio alginolyticus]HAV1497969.1 phage head closure protein [Vibrio parahaemolyticus]HAV1503138.1 phage head closure protein [Vibrio parahaemolyticus]HBL4682767.1 phage head closure protein [Vibrio parahaemolyticus]
MRPINAGKMRHRIQIYDVVNTRGESGELINEKALFRTVSARIEHDRNEETGEVVRQAQDTVTFGIRYRKDLEYLDSSMYIVFRNREYDVESVINTDYLNRELLITCKMRGK